MNLEVLQKDKYYHLFNRGINRTNIFIDDENKRYFLKLFKKHLSGKCELFAYCLMDNHFHFAVKIMDDPENITQAFSNFFNAYAKAFNKYTNRSGSLFEKHFRRIELVTEEYFKNLIIYIHQNPKSHFGLAIDQFQFSSYIDYLKSNNEIISVENGLSLFGDLDNFRFVHKQTTDYKDFTD
ncbi:MAG: hypothetical protein EOO50_01120 [Flavobacterium sp.]|uniref:transposase n=1 Tax=Flavobacterium sp. TaxID=239 RepID=UPI0012048400|nr:transposase [Flavobacterium sp.]RZJ68557.1 MAG: hypothetical protein EOO50_01120 [Flavobacterium sp.]